MKLIIAYVKPERLNDVKQALYEAQVYNMSVTNIVGSGRQRGYSETYRGAEMEVNLLKKVRLEIGVNDNFVQPAIDAITKGARTGQIGDGVLFVLPVEQALRIRTGELGPPAMG
ncbi:MAG: P-II family nitrogen regulator [Desulfarculus sp.]|nr:P-II family nitrogen regulator [Desulfarculus sp.]